MPIKIVLVDDHLMIRKGVRDLLSAYPDFRVIAEYEKGSHLLNGLREEVPDIILLDLQLPDHGGEELLPILRKEYPEVKVIILTSNENTYTIKLLLNAGAHGYVFKNADGSLLEEAIRHVYQNDTPFLDQPVKESMRRKTKEAIHQISLTPREADVLRLIAKEHTSQEIGDILEINHRTVEIYRLGIMQKLGVKNMVGMVKKAILLGLITE